MSVLYRIVFRALRRAMIARRAKADAMRVGIVSLA